MKAPRFVAALAFGLLTYSQAVSPAIKQNYGGNLKVAEELLVGITAQQLFDTSGEEMRPLVPAPASWEESSVTLDFNAYGPEVTGEIERAVAGLQNYANSCHWILDYPYLDHRHPNTVEAAEGKLTVSVQDPEVLRDLLSNTCIIPAPVGALQPFHKTQYGYEANSGCLGGRPFLDSITPAPVDPLNPFLSFKLNDADVISVPEERFAQVSRDPEIVLLPGPKSYVFIKTFDFPSNSALALASALRVQEIARAALNGHADILLNAAPSGPLKAGIRLSFRFPQEPPYKLLAERITLQWKEAGIDASASGASAGPAGEMIVFPVRAANEDLLRYQILRKHFPLVTDTRPWHEVWDELEASGRLIPLLVHRSMMALRRNVRDVRNGPEGMPAFADAWIEPGP